MEFKAGQIVVINPHKNYGVHEDLVCMNYHRGVFTNYIDDVRTTAAVMFSKTLPMLPNCNTLVTHVLNLTLLEDDEDMQNDPVNHPKHYNSAGIKCSNCGQGIEAITVTRAFNFNLGNVIKYVWRAIHKNGIEDLRKAAWYLNDHIKTLEKEHESK